MTEKYRKKPVVVEAVRWNGLNLSECQDFTGTAAEYDMAWKAGAASPGVTITIHTLEGDMEVSKGDYIIKGVNGEFYPCKPDIFEKSYDKTEGDAKEMTNQDRLEAALFDFIERETKEPSSGAALQIIPRVARVLVDIWRY